MSISLNNPQPDVIKIPLTRGHFTLVDGPDADLVSQFKWCAARRGSTWYAVRSLDLPDGRKTARYLHTFLTGFSLVDHINGDGLDNRRSNLREAQQTLNMRNARKRAGTSSQFKGVYWSQRDRCWRAQIRAGGPARYLGGFPDEVSAALAYDAAARMFSGGFAALNFPKSGERSAHQRGESDSDTFTAAEVAERPTATHCPNAHLYDDRNTHIDRHGIRRCRKCAAARHKRWRDRRPTGISHVACVEGTPS